MGTNVSTKLFPSAPPVAANAGTANGKSVMDLRRTPSERSGKDFSKELKNATGDDKLSDVVEAEVKANSDNPVVAKADTAEEKATATDDKSVTAEDVPEAEEDTAEAVVSPQSVVSAPLIPMAELTTYFQPTDQEGQGVVVDTAEFSQPNVDVVNNEVGLQQTVIPAEKGDVIVAQPDIPTVDPLAEKTATPVQQMSVPEPANVVQQTVPLQQPVEKIEADQGMAPKTDVMMAEIPVEDNAPVMTPNDAQPQPKSIEALLKPVQPMTMMQRTAQTDEGAGQYRQSDVPVVSNEQQMLAVLSGKRIISQQPSATDEVQVSKPVVGDMNNLLGQQVQVINNDGAGQNFGNDGRQPQQNFQQEMEAEAVVAQAQPQQVDSEEPAFADRINSTQAVNASATPPTQTTDSVVQANNQQPVNQPRTDYQINQQIVEQARLLRNAENTEMVIKLNPRHLGDLTLKVAVNSNGGVTATFHTDNAQVRAMLETSMIQLQRDLNEQGIKVDSVEVQTGLSDGQLPEGQGQGYYQQQEQKNVRNQQLDLKDFEDDVDSLSAEPVNNATGVIRDSEGNKISDGVDYAV